MRQVSQYDVATRHVDKQSCHFIYAADAAVVSVSRHESQEMGRLGGVTLGKRLGTFNMTVDKYNLNSQTGKGREGVVCCFFISNHSGLMIWHHMQNV